MNEELATSILEKIFANHTLYWCMGDRGASISSINGDTSSQAFITIDGSTEITKEELDFLGKLARKTAPSGH